MESNIFVVIIIICTVLIVVGIVKDNFNLIVNFLARIFAGVAGIFIVNWLIINSGLLLNVGVNSYTALTVGIFGVPGFLFIYGVAMYYYFVKV